VLPIEQGKWSDWLHVKFKVGMFQAVRGLVRFHLVRLSPFELYASPVNFDPEAPPFPISAPADYAGELSARIGPFYTAGMPEDHRGLSNERFSEMAYLDQCADIVRERERMMLFELDRFDEGFFFCLFDTPDRIQHMFWRFGEEGHPANRGDVTREMREVIGEHYRACDRIVGEVIRYVDERTALLVLSDHGMSSFQRGVHLNTWLARQGLLAFKAGSAQEEQSADFFRVVDWSRTKAYSLGLGAIYLNLRGREAHGIVPADDANPLRAAIAAALTGLADPARGEVAISSVAVRDTIYAGPYLNEAPDLLINFARGYRASWATTLGGSPPGLFEDNVRKWGGDHIIDPRLVPGVLFVNRPLAGTAPDLLDMAPTILAVLGVEKPPAMEGQPLLS
jgi:predicted AlkP superfamily phosphohydrolase/phosphomutase